MTSSDLAERIVAAAADKKAREIVTVDLQGKTNIADFFVICEGDTDRQLRAIVDSIEDACRDVDRRPLRVDGVREGTWACLDFDSVIVHVLLPGERSYYDIEGLWEAVAAQRVG